MSVELETIIDRDQGHDDTPDPLLIPLADHRRHDPDPDHDVGQLDRVEAKLDAVLAFAGDLADATAPLADMLDNPGGLMGLFGGMLRG